jgi:hypothetical protein
MKGRVRWSHVTIALALIAALAIAAPAIGGLSLKQLVKKEVSKQVAKANQKANAAQSSANAAQSAANQAQSTANSAQSTANSAQGSANQALGQQGTFAYQSNATATTTTLFEGGGLRIEASCPGGVPTIDARSLVDNSTIHLATIIDGDVAHYNEGDDFDSNVTRSLAVDGFTDNVQGTFTFHNGNGVNAPTVTATYLIEQNDFQANACAAFGNVEIV